MTIEAFAEVDRARALLAAARAFGESLGDPHELIEALANRLADAIGDACLVRLRDEEGGWAGDLAFAPATSALPSALLELTHGADLDDAATVGKLREHNPHTVLALPLRAGDEVRGLLVLIRLNRDQPYTEDDQRFATDMVECAGVALGVANQLQTAARDRAELDRLLEREAALLQLGSWALERTDPEKLFEHAVETVAHTLGVQFSAIGLLNTDDDPLSAKLVAGVGWRDALVGSYSSVLSPEIANHVETPHVWSWEAGRAPPMLEEHAIRSCVDAPIAPPDRSHPPIGVIAALSTQPDAFRPSDIRFLESVGQILASAIDRHDLLTALRERAGEFRAIADHSPDVIARFDSNLRHVYVNPAVERVTGMSSENIIGRTNRELGLPEEILTRIELGLRSAFRTAHEQTLTVRLALDDGEHLFEVRLVPELAQAGTVMTVLAVARDVTDRERALAERERLYQDALERERRLERILEGVVADYQAERRRASGAVVLKHLTPREQQVLLLLAKGESNSEIARTLSLAVGTVKNHVADILSKLGVADRTQAAVQAIALGLAPLGPNGE